MFLISLPNEILRMIFEHLEYVDLKCLPGVCSHFANLLSLKTPGGIIDRRLFRDTAEVLFKDLTTIELHPAFERILCSTQFQKGPSDLQTRGIDLLIPLAYPLNVHRHGQLSSEEVAAIRKEFGRKGNRNSQKLQTSFRINKVPFFNTKSAAENATSPAISYLSVVLNDTTRTRNTTRADGICTRGNLDEQYLPPQVQVIIDALFLLLYTETNNRGKRRIHRAMRGPGNIEESIADHRKLQESHFEVAYQYKWTGVKLEVEEGVPTVVFNVESNQEV